MERFDDEELRDDTIIWRRIIPSWISQGNNGAYELQSWAFVDRHTGEVSVSVAALTTPEKMLEGRPDDSLVAIAVGLVRSVKGKVAKTPENPDAAHRVLCYENNSQMKKASKTLSDSSNYNWIVFRVPPTVAGDG